MRLFLFLVFLTSLVTCKTLIVNLRKHRQIHKRHLNFGTKISASHNLKQSDTGSPLQNIQNDFYLSDITIGTPEQHFSVLMDTGSANLWVFQYSPWTLRTGSGYFVPHMSSTFKNDSRRFEIVYEDSSYSGYLAVDTISFAGFTIVDQTFGIISSPKTENDVYIDGVFGLGWPSLAVGGVVSPIQAILSQLDYPMFTVFMGKEQKSCDHSDLSCTGRITYGGLDSTYCSSDITYVKLSATAFWQFTLEGFQMGDYREGKHQQAISDTGTSWLGVPKDVMRNVVALTGAKYVRKSDVYILPCDKPLPIVYFKIGGVEYDVPPEEYLIDMGMRNGQCVLTFFEQQSNGFIPPWILGDTWIRSFCNIYDFGKRRIGFARPKTRNDTSKNAANTFNLSIVVALTVLIDCHS